MFHSFSNGGPNGGLDPLQQLFTVPDKGDLSDFNTFVPLINGSPGSITYNTNCAGSGANCFTLPSCFGNTQGTWLPCHTNSTIILSKSSFSLSEISARQLWVVQTFDYLFNVTFNTSPRNTDWGWYLTTNGTINSQGHDIGSGGPSATPYNPKDDPSVIMVGEYFCSATCSANNRTIGYNVYMLRTLGKGDNIGNEDTGSCSQAGSPYLCPASGRLFNTISGTSAILNFTSGNNGGSCNTSTLLGPSCSFVNVGSNTQASQKLPWLQFQSQQYYLGYWVAPSVGQLSACGFVCQQSIQFFVTNNVGGNNYFDLYTPNSPSPTLDTGGFFGPVIKALVNIGVWILNALLGFVAFIAPAIQTAINFLETQVTSLLNLIGNALGFGNIGTDLANFLNAVINFFTQQLPNYIGNFPSYVTNFLSLLSIEFPFLTPLFTIANAILAFGVNGVAEGIVILTIGLQMFLFGYGTLMVAAYFFYVGDDSIGGFFSYLGTLEALSFKILNLIATVTNLGIDILVHVISLIPKPFIQMGAGHLPRLPTVESSAGISFPKMDFGEARNGNLIVYWLWCMGLWFLTWFESRNPSLPGSIGALDPAVATNIRQLASYIPLMQAATLVSGGLVLIWFCMLPLRLAGIDVTEAPVGAALGRVTGPGPGSVSVSAGKKHLIGRAKRIQQEIEAGKEAERKAKGKIAETKQKIKEKKESEKLRQEELKRKPTGKDLRGPNLT